MSAQYTFDEYPSLNNHINQFLVGSDQLWNYWCSKNMGNYYMLDFVHADRKKFLMLLHLAILFIQHLRKFVNNGRQF